MHVNISWVVFAFLAGALVGEMITKRTVNKWYDRRKSDRELRSDLRLATFGLLALVAFSLVFALLVRWLHIGG